MNIDFSGKVALITGAASGMGRSTALAFAKAGASVVVADISADAGNETARLIGAAGGQATFIAVDVASAASVEALIAATVKRYGRLDCAFNNAGIQIECGRLADLSEAEWDKTIAVNQKGVFLCLKFEIAQMLRQGGGGAIVNTASIAGLRTEPMMSAYSSSKFGVVGLTRNAAAEYAADRIRINAVCPGAIRTPMLERGIARDPETLRPMVEQMAPAKRIGEPEEIAAAVLWLCSDLSSYVFGAQLPVDGGFLAA